MITCMQRFPSKSVLLLSFVLFIFGSCQQNGKENDDQNKEVAVSAEQESVQPEEMEEAFVSVDFDETPYHEIIIGLKGIEKFYVKNDLVKLHSLLKFNEDQRFKELEQDLKGRQKYVSFNTITILDARNGYMSYNQSAPDRDNTMVYWNKTNGEKLIALAYLDCTMFCDGSISFTTYDPETDTYTGENNSDVIEDWQQINQLRPENLPEDEGYDSRYELPRQGKNIRYCAAETCLELLWKDGVFLLI